MWIYCFPFFLSFFYVFCFIYLVDWPCYFDISTLVGTFIALWAVWLTGAVFLKIPGLSRHQNQLLAVSVYSSSVLFFLFLFPCNCLSWYFVLWCTFVLDPRFKIFARVLSLISVLQASNLNGCLQIYIWSCIWTGIIQGNLLFMYLNVSLTFVSQVILVIWWF